jgi:hypothetical protein
MTNVPVRRASVANSLAEGKGPLFFVVVSFVNPHDIMYGDANLPKQPQV